VDVAKDEIATLMHVVAGDRPQIDRAEISPTGVAKRGTVASRHRRWILRCMSVRVKRFLSTTFGTEAG
jgi:hypothetical protein